MVKIFRNILVFLGIAKNEPKQKSKRVNGDILVGPPVAEKKKIEIIRKEPNEAEKIAHWILYNLNKEIENSIYCANSPDNSDNFSFLVTENGIICYVNSGGDISIKFKTVEVFNFGGYNWLRRLELDKSRYFKSSYDYGFTAMWYNKSPEFVFQNADINETLLCDIKSTYEKKEKEKRDIEIKRKENELNLIKTYEPLALCKPH